MGINLGGMAAPEPAPEILAQPGVEQTSKPNGELTLNLAKNVSIDLSKAAPTLIKAKVGLGWNPMAGIDMDLDVFALALHNGKIKDTSDIIYFGQKDTGKSIVLNGDNRTGEGEGDDEIIEVDLSKVPSDIDKIVFYVNIYDAEKKQQNFGMVNGAYIRLVNYETDKEECIYILNEQGGLNTAFHFANLTRNGNSWSFETVGTGENGDVNIIANKYA